MRRYLKRRRRRIENDELLRQQIVLRATTIEKTTASYGVDRILDPRLGEIELAALEIRKLVQR